MVEHSLSAAQRRVGFGLMATIFGGFAWAACPGWPASWWGPRACFESKESGPEGRGAEFGSIAQGDGPPTVFQAQSCAACHFQGGVGGGGANWPGVIAADRPATAGRTDPRGGSLRLVALGDRSPAPFASKGSLLPVRRQLMEGSRALIDDHGKGRAELVNSPALFGLGLVDRISDRAIRQVDRRGPVDLPGGALPAVAAGRPHILPDGRVGKFGWKAQFATLEEFLAAGCGKSVGLSNPARSPILPVARARPVPVPVADQWQELMAFVVALPPPEAIRPDSAADADSARRGEAHFAAVGCVACHKPDLGGLRGIYGDFLLHRLDDRAGAVPLAATAAVLAEEWRTPALWGVADTAPYLHDGSASTLEAAIARHGGDAAAVRRAYDGLDEGGRGDVVAFLRTLRAPVADPVGGNMAATRTTPAAPDAMNPGFMRMPSVVPQVMHN